MLYPNVMDLQARLRSRRWGGRC